MQAAGSQAARVSPGEDANPANSPMVSAEPAREVAEKPALAVRPTLTIPAGMRIRVRLAQTLDTKGAAAGATSAFITGLPAESPLVFCLRSGVKVRCG